jgi:hypothetical protein
LEESGRNIKSKSIIPIHGLENMGLWCGRQPLTPRTCTDNVKTSAKEINYEDANKIRIMFNDSI